MTSSLNNSTVSQVPACAPATARYDGALLVWGFLRMTSSTVGASPAGRRLFNDILGGTAASVLTIAYGLSYSLLIFAGPLAPYLGIGIGITFTVSAVISLVLALGSS